MVSKKLNSVIIFVAFLFVSTVLYAPDAAIDLEKIRGDSAAIQDEWEAKKKVLMENIEEAKLGESFAEIVIKKMNERGYSKAEIELMLINIVKGTKDFPQVIRVPQDVFPIVVVPGEGAGESGRSDAVGDRITSLESIRGDANLTCVAKLIELVGQEISVASWVSLAHEYQRAKLTPTSMLDGTYGEYLERLFVNTFMGYANEWENMKVGIKKASDSAMGRPQVVEPYWLLNKRLESIRWQIIDQIRGIVQYEMGFIIDSIGSDPAHEKFRTPEGLADAFIDALYSVRDLREWSDTKFKDVITILIDPKYPKELPDYLLLPDSPKKINALMDKGDFDMELALKSMEIAIGQGFERVTSSAWEAVFFNFDALSYEAAKNSDSPEGERLTGLLEKFSRMIFQNISHSEINAVRQGFYRAIMHMDVAHPVFLDELAERLKIEGYDLNIEQIRIELAQDIRSEDHGTRPSAGEAGWEIPNQVRDLISERMSRNILSDSQWERVNTPEKLGTEFIKSFDLAAIALDLTDAQKQDVLARMIDPENLEYKPLYIFSTEAAAKLSENIMNFEMELNIRVIEKAIGMDPQIVTPSTWEAVFASYEILSRFLGFNPTSKAGEITKIALTRLYEAISRHIRSNDVQTVSEGFAKALERSDDPKHLTGLAERLCETGFDPRVSERPAERIQTRRPSRHAEASRIAGAVAGNADTTRTLGTSRLENTKEIDALEKQAEKGRTPEARNRAKRLLAQIREQGVMKTLRGLLSKTKKR